MINAKTKDTDVYKRNRKDNLEEINREDLETKLIKEFYLYGQQRLKEKKDFAKSSKNLAEKYAKLIDETFKGFEEVTEEEVKRRVYFSNSSIINSLKYWLAIINKSIEIRYLSAVDERIPYHALLKMEEFRRLAKRANIYYSQHLNKEYYQKICYTLFLCCSKLDKNINPIIFSKVYYDYEPSIFFSMGHYKIKPTKFKMYLISHWV